MNAPPPLVGFPKRITEAGGICSVAASSSNPNDTKARKHGADQVIAIAQLGEIIAML